MSKIMFQSTPEGGHLLVGAVGDRAFRVEWDAQDKQISETLEKREPEPTPVLLESLPPVPPLTEEAPTNGIPKPGRVLTLALKTLIKREPNSSCKCKQHAAQMDKWGWIECWRRRATITEWMIEGANELGHDIKPADAFGLIMAAWREINGDVPTEDENKQ